MEFVDNKHRETFEEFLSYGRSRRMSISFKTALYILSSPLLADRTRGYVNNSPGIEFTKLMEAAKKSWNLREMALISLAWNLFNGSWPADVNRTFLELDKENTEIALEAMRIRFSRRLTDNVF